MPAPNHRNVQTDKTDGDQFITLPVVSNGRVAYDKVCLRTRHRVVTRRHACALTAESKLRLTANIGVARDNPSSIGFREKTAGTFFAFHA